MMASQKDTVLSKLSGGLIVSIQAEKQEPLGSTEMIMALAKTIVPVGAAGVRLASAEHTRAFKTLFPDVPVIAITKPDTIPDNAHELVYITPTLSDALELAQAGADIIAMDATARPRPNGHGLDEIVITLKQQYPDILLMADIATEAEAREAEGLGFDFVGTTLSGYTTETLNCCTEGPDFELLETLIDELRIPVVMEGRISTPQQYKQALALGAFAVVVGSAITRPAWITKQFLL